MNTFAAASMAFKADNWLITSDGFKVLTEVVSSQSANMAAVASKKLNPLAGVSNQRRTKATILPVVGPLATYENFISSAFGWTTYQSLARELARLDADEQVGEIVLYMDTPGGASKGLSEAAYSVKSCKTNVSTYVAGTCASAGYWLASQSSSIAGAPDSIVGSIGVRAGFFGPERGVLTSKNAPNKSLNQAGLQAVIDELEELFLEAVSDGRNVSIDEIKQNYGKGGVMTGRKAATAGMIDSVSLFGEFLNGSNDGASRAQHSDDDGWAEAYAEIADRQNEVISYYPNSMPGRRVY